MIRVALLLALPTTLLQAAPAAAQDRWEPRGPIAWDRAADTLPRSLDVSLSGGVLYSSDWSDLVLLGTIGGATGSFQQVLLRELSVSPGPVGSAAVTYWHGRYGARLQGGFSRSCLAVGPACATAVLDPDEAPFAPPVDEIGVSTWLLDVSGVIRLSEPRPGRWVLPYVTVGLGGVLYDPDVEVAELVPRFLDVPRQEPLGDGTTLIVIDETAAFLLSVDEAGLTTSAAFLLGAGTDVRIPMGAGGVGLRFELVNHITASPFRLRLTPLDGRSGGRRPAAEPVTFEFGSVHNLRLTAGLVVALGLR